MRNNLFKPIRLEPIRLIKPKLNLNPRLPKLYGKHFSVQGKDFETKVRSHLRKKGYKVSKSHNRHYDIHAEKNGKTYYVECKCKTARLSDAQFDFSRKVTNQGKVYVRAKQSPTGRVKLRFYR